MTFHRAAPANEPFRPNGGRPDRRTFRFLNPYNTSRMKKTSFLTSRLCGAVLAIAAAFPAPVLHAQKTLERGYASITQQRSENLLGFLADDLLEGRDAGQRGGQIAARYIVSMLSEWGIAPLAGQTYYQPFDVAQVTKPQRGPWQVHPDSIAKVKSLGAHHLRHLNNILAAIPGKRANEYVIVGAHYDHEGIVPDLADDCIYNGADDNASGVVAVMQIARAFALSGQQPERTVVFALWDGEEKGLLGSRFFVNNWQKPEQIKCYLNFDMVGRGPVDNPQHLSYIFTASHPTFGDWMRKDMEERKFCFVPAYRPWDNPVGGSDNGSFAKVGVPIIWYHTEGHPDYTRPSDTTNRINFPKLTDICRASFLTAWRMANEKAY